MVEENGATRQGGAPAKGSNFYQQVTILRLPQHKDLRLAKRLDFSFAAGTIAAPLTISEVALASRHYPIVFSEGETPTPIAVLGLRPGENLFVDAAGQWRDGFYVPAHIRRYPFGLVQTPGTNTLSLAVDIACDRVLADGTTDGQESDRLFDENGAATPTATAALELCKAMQRDLRPTDAYGKALVNADLLVAKRAEFKLPGDHKIKLDGFRIVDEQQFRDMPDAMLGEWHRNGWLAVTSLHLVSRQNWSILAELHIARAAAAEQAQSETSVPVEVKSGEPEPAKAPEETEQDSQTVDTDENLSEAAQTESEAAEVSETEPHEETEPHDHAELHDEAEPDDGETPKDRRPDQA